MASKFYTLATDQGFLSSEFYVPPGSHFSRVVTPIDHFQHKKPVRCMNSLTTHDNITFDQNIGRRSADYQPTIWKHEFIQSIESNHVESMHVERTAKLKENVKHLLEEVESSFDKLKIIDDLERLGVSYHFEDEISIILKEICENNNDTPSKEDLFATSLKFRLLRQHGCRYRQDVFKSFMDERGKFKASLSKDTEGLLHLYEASYLSLKGETILDEARKFSTKHLKDSLENKEMDPDLAMSVAHALELPLRWRMQRLEARWYIDVYERRSNMKPIVLELAKLDFNMVQATHQEDLKHASRWWRRSGLGENLTFARDRLVEYFLWSVGIQFEPQFQQSRRMLTRVVALITTIDDVYDVYGTLEELELFTNAVERWDTTAMEQLPDYMKISYLTLFNFVNEMAHDILIGQGLLVIPHLKKVWADICKSFLLEAKWYHTDYKPTLEEYLNNAWISVGGPVMILHTYFLDSKPIEKAELVFSEKYLDIIRWSSMITRFLNDLGTSSIEMERGDNRESIQCYMHETGASEEDAREHIKFLIRETWKNINEYALKEDYPTIPKAFIMAAMNFSRMAQCVYQYGDGHSSQDSVTKDRVNSLLVNPIPF